MSVAYNAYDLLHGSMIVGLGFYLAKTINCFIKVFFPRANINNGKTELLFQNN